MWQLRFWEPGDSGWIVARRASNPYRPFPDKPYFRPLLTVIQQEPVFFIEKSRDMMISWLCVGFFTHAAMTNEHREVLFQSQKEDKAAVLVDYAKTLYDQQNEALKRRFPLTKPVREQSALGIAFVSLRDGFDLTTPSGRAMFGMCAVMAEFERALIRERVKAGMANAKRKGIRIGRPSGPAFDVDMKAVRARRSSGESLRSIAMDLGCSASLLVKRFKSL